MIFELKHSIGADHFSYFDCHTLDFPMHVHRSFECFVQRRGSTLVTIDGKTTLLSDGDAVLIFPFQKHSYKSVKGGSVEVCIFSGDIIRDYSRQVDGIAPKTNTFRFDLGIPDYSNRCLVKAFCYGVCGKFSSVPREFVKVETGDDLLTSMLVFIEENFAKECSLSDVTKSLGYDYAYISKLFKRRIGMPFNEYVNARRIQDSLYYLKATDKTISEILELCGFSSYRTFSRQFSTSVGVSPSEYRKGEK